MNGAGRSAVASSANDVSQIPVHDDHFYGDHQYTWDDCIQAWRIVKPKNRRIQKEACRRGLPEKLFKAWPREGGDAALMGKSSKKRADGSIRSAANPRTMPKPMAVSDSRWKLFIDTGKQPSYTPNRQKQYLIKPYQIP
jgi:hypothetical protein